MDPAVALALLLFVALIGGIALVAGLLAAEPQETAWDDAAGEAERNVAGASER